MTVLDRLEKSTSFWFLLATSVFFFLLRLPSLFEPYWYGDEGIYQVIGLALNRGRLLYSGIWDNKPPLLYIVYALFNGDQFALRLVSLIFGIASVVVFLALSKLLLSSAKNTKIAYVSTALFALLFGLPLLEGNIANAENFMLLPILAAGYLVFKLFQTSNYTLYAIRYTLFLSGLLVGLAFLFKIVAMFDAAAFFLFLLFLSLPKKIALKSFVQTALSLFPYVLGCILPIGLSAIFFLAKGGFSDFLKASFLQNVGYVAYGNALIIPQGLLILKLAVLALFVFYLLVKRNVFSKPALFIFLWFSFSLFNAFFSGRPYTHYTLVLLPSFILLLALFFWQNSYRKFTAAVLIITALLVLKNFSFYGNTLYYYQNFLSFLTGNKSVAAYQSFFDKKTPIDYDIAQYLSMHMRSNDNLFIWGNNAQVYKLTDKLPPGRYAVAYHITGYKDGTTETQAALSHANPRFILIMPGQGTFPFSLAGYTRKINIEDAQIYEKVL
ncbi:MAG TPA: glycosyltransferase family 39 protein [Candidatus Saccharimonadales bacterium]|nr:glycosyltransferase family 39 protein [Candidatus Saccharimonadales bacterium]